MKKIYILSFILLVAGVLSAATFINGRESFWPVESNGAVPVNVQDQTSPPFDLYFVKATGDATTLATAPSIGDTIISLTDSTGFVDGSFFGIFCPENNRFFFGEQVGAATGNDIVVDTPVDFTYQAGDNVLEFSRDLNVDGSTTTQIFEIQGVGASGTVSLDITRLMIQMTTDTIPNFGEFGDIDGGLTYGLALRQFDGHVQNIWNIKLNEQFALHAFDYETYLATNPAQGENGIAIRYTFAGQDKHGVAIRLEPGDSLELWVQDNLSTILSMRVLAEGHIVTD